MALDVTKELGQNFIEYAAAVNTDRSIPDAKSGLKPVARRIIWGAFDTGRLSSKAYVKNARIVGDVMGSLHPHGDSSIYGALVRLSQPWIMRYPLIDFHGNQGSISGDGPAAMRYTEGRLHKIAEDGMLAGIKKNCVDFMPNYSDDEEEPVTLPAVFPNLLCNPNNGIGVALACSWACHNLGEVQDAILTYMNGEEPMLPGPDFPTGGIIINKNDIPTIMKTGHGSVKIRSKYEVKKNKIIVTEIPYGTTVEGLLDELGKYCEENENCGIIDIRDNTDNKGVAISIEVNKNSNPNSVMQKLFAKTNLQTSFSYNQVALVNKVPTELNLKDCCEIYVNHNIECIVREIKFDLQKASDRLHIVEGLLIALEDIDNVIQLIKSSANSSVAKDNLMQKYSLSESQAKAILDMKLSRLAKLEKLELENEKKELINTIENYKNILASEDKQKNILKERLANIVKKYGDKRRTELVQLDAPTKEEKEIVNIEPEKCVVIMTEDGYIKRVPITSFRTQRRNGKGVKSLGDIITDTIRTNTIDNLMVFTNKGNMYRILVDNIPEGTNSSKGVPVQSLISVPVDETPNLIYSLYRGTEEKYLIFVTKMGLVKKTSLEEYIKTKRKAGIAAIGIKDGDELMSVNLITDEDIILLTKKGTVIRVSAKEFPAAGRTTMGIKGISLTKDDYIVAALPIRHDTDNLALFTSTGTGKKVSLKEIPSQKRAGKGISVYKNVDIVGASLIEDNDNLLLVGTKNSICISAKDVPLMSRAAVGNIMIKGNINSVSKV